MKGILSLLIGLIIIMIGLKPSEEESYQDITFNVYSLGAKSVDIYSSIKSYVPDKNNSLNVRSISGNQPEDEIVKVKPDTWNPEQLNF